MNQENEFKSSKINSEYLRRLIQKLEEREKRAKNDRIKRNQKF